MSENSSLKSSQEDAYTQGALDILVLLLYDNAKKKEGHNDMAGKLIKLFGILAEARVETFKKRFGIWD